MQKGRSASGADDIRPILRNPNYSAASYMKSVSKITRKRVPAPGFVAARPMFPAIVRLFDDLGRTNQYILVNELAARELRDQARSYVDGLEHYVERISKKHRIRVSISEFDAVSSTLHGWYVSLTYTAVDRSLRQLIREITQYKRLNAWIDRRGSDQLGALEQLAANQPSGQRRLDSYPEFKVLEYYRLVRNEHVHPPRSSQRPSLGAHKKLVDEWSTYIFDTYKCGSAPNLPDAIAMDDFFLFSRIARDFSAVLSDAYDLTIADISAIALTDDQLSSALKTSSGTKHRIENIFRHYYIENHLRRGDETSFSHANAFANEMLLRFEGAFSDSASRRRPAKAEDC